MGEEAWRIDKCGVTGWQGRVFNGRDANMRVVIGGVSNCLGMFSPFRFREGEPLVERLRFWYKDEARIQASTINSCE